MEPLWYQNSLPAHAQAELRPSQECSPPLELKRQLLTSKTQNRTSEDKKLSLTYLVVLGDYQFHSTRV
jgi:hypothetical protein